GERQEVNIFHQVEAVQAFVQASKESVKRLLCAHVRSLNLAATSKRFDDVPADSDGCPLPSSTGSSHATAADGPPLGRPGAP
ncbi:hypothetical protein, partial [Streptomyces sp. JV178]|uniref:hypothetical protein n=1 Tax=Streptomyces sp. JV178 TaxID=858632 RepID=UPI001C556BF1